MYMVKLSQKELVQEDFRDKIRGIVNVGRAVGRKAVSLVTPTGVGVYDKTKAGIKNLATAYTKEQPLSVLKQALAKNPEIEFIKKVGEERRPANPNRKWYKQIVRDKNVTLITFEANIYKKGTVRDYKVYEAANSLITRPSSGVGMPNQSLKKEPTRNMRQAKGKVIDVEPEPSQKDVPQRLSAPQNETPEVKTLTAEIFRTTNGLQVGEIYDTKTGAVYYSKEKQVSLPDFNTEIAKFRNPTASGYEVKNLLRFLQQVVKIGDSDAANIVNGARNLKDLISISTGVPANNINAIIPDANISKLGDALRPLYVESSVTNMQKNVINEIFLLKNNLNHLQSHSRKNKWIVETYTEKD